MSLEIQFYTFFMMFSSGWSLGILFDVYRVVSRPFKLRAWVYAIFDLVFWIIATWFVFKMLYMSNYGEFRFFVFLGLLLGTWFYFYFISKYIVIVIQFTIKVLKRVVQFVVRCFQVIIIGPLKMLHRLLVIFFGGLLALAIFLFKIVVQLFYPILFIVRTIKQRFSKGDPPDNGGQ